MKTALLIPVVAGMLIGGAVGSIVTTMVFMGVPKAHPKSFGKIPEKNFFSKKYVNF